MIDLATLPDDLMIARGQYSTVRGMHEDELHRMQILCGQHASYGTQFLRRVQPSKGQLHESITPLIGDARDVLRQIEECAMRIEALAQQRAELRGKAWK